VSQPLSHVQCCQRTPAMDLLGLLRLHTGRKLHVADVAMWEAAVTGNESFALGVCACTLTRDHRAIALQIYSSAAATPGEYIYACSTHERTDMKMAQASHGGSLSSGSAAFAAVLQVQHAASRDAGGNQSHRSFDGKDEMQETRSN
jgi:hypothetical protein